MGLGFGIGKLLNKVLFRSGTLDVFSTVYDLRPIKQLISFFAPDATCNDALTAFNSSRNIHFIGLPEDQVVSLLS